MINKDSFQGIVSEIAGYVFDSIIGPSISAFLDKLVLRGASEHLIAFVYFLGFSLSVFRIWQSVKTRKIRFLERMVYRKQKKNGEELEGGIVDSNSVGMAEWVSKI